MRCNKECGELRLEHCEIAALHVSIMVYIYIYIYIYIYMFVYSELRI
jgi:hypothetical protein